MKVIYSISTGMEAWTKVIQNLKEEKNWMPKYIISQPDSEEIINELFPDTIFHSRTRGFQAQPPKSHPKNLKFQYPIDSEVISGLMESKSIALEMMDKQDPGNVTGNHFTYRDRSHQFYKSLICWQAVVEYIEPDLAIFTESPHNLGEYILYSILERREVDTIIYKQTKLPNLFYTTKRLDDTPLENISKYNTKIDRKYEKYINNIQVRQDNPDSDSAGRKYNYKKVFDYMRKASDYNSISKIINMVVEEHKSTDSSRFFHNSKSYMSRKGNPPSDSKVTTLQWILYRLKAKWYKSKLRKIYENYSVMPDNSDKYIYYPLHYQPERTTCPDGGIYNDQYLVANMVSYYLPDDWKIYIKEHPAQWSDSRRGELGRNKQFYDDLLSIEKVTFINTSASTYSLIDSSEAVVTITGTAGWEAPIRGKPSIIFGPSTWYRGCPGVYYIQAHEQLQRVINRIKSGETVSKKDIKSFVKVVQEVGYRGYIASGHKNKQVDATTNIENLTEAAIVQQRQF